MNLINLFRKERRITPQWTTTYPPNRSPDDVKRITPKEKVITPTKITGVLRTTLPDNRPTINDWAKQVNFSVDYEKVLYEQFKRDLASKSEQLLMNKEYVKKFGVESKIIPLKIRIMNFLNRHL